MSAVQTPASSPIFLVLNCPTSTDRQTAARLQGRPVRPSVPVLSGQCSKRLAPAFSRWPNKASVVAVNRTCHSPGLSDRGFSTGMTWESATDAMLHGTGTSSLKPGHGQTVSWESIKTNPLHHSAPPHAPRALGRSSEVTSATGQETANPEKSVSIEKGVGWVYVDELGDRKGKKEKILLTSGQTFFLERLRNNSRLILCQHGSRNFKSNGKLQRNYLNIIILILNKLNYTEDTMPLHRQWPHCCYMRWPRIIQIKKCNTFWVNGW